MASTQDTVPEAIALQDEAVDTASPDDTVPSLRTIRVAVPGTILASPVLVAESKGYYEDAGLDVEITTVANDNIALQMLRNGEADVIAGSMYDIALERSRVGTRIVVPKQLFRAHWSDDWVNAEGMLRLHSMPENVFDEPCQLEGQKVGVPVLNDLLQLAVRRAMQDNGCAVDRVILVRLDEQARLDALLSREIVAAAFMEPWSLQASTSGATVTYNLDSSLCKRCVVGVIGAEREFAEENRELIEQFGTAVDKAIVLSTVDHIAYRADLVTCCALPVENAATMVLPNFEATTRDLAPQIADLLQVMREDGSLRGRLTADEFVLAPVG